MNAFGNVDVPERFDTETPTGPSTVPAGTVTFADVSSTTPTTRGLSRNETAVVWVRSGSEGARGYRDERESRGSHTAQAATNARHHVRQMHT